MYARGTVFVASALIVLLGGGGLAVADTDVPVDGDGAVELAPHSGPNGQYATIGEEGELRIDFEGLLDDSTTRADDVFNVTASGDRTVEIWIEHDAEATTFYRDADPTAAIDDGSRTIVAPGETIEVGIFTDTRHPDVNPTTITIYATFVEPEDDPDPEPGVSPRSDIRVVNLSVAEERLVAGENTTVTATVENRGDATGEETITLFVDGIDVDRQTVMLAPGEETRLDFDRTFQLPGEYTIRVGDHTATIVVEEPEAPAPLFSVVDVSVDPTTVEPGEPVTVTATITNTGERDGTFIAELSVDRAVQASTTTFVPAGENSTVVFERTFDTDGERAIAVSGIEGETVSVRSPSALPDRILTPTQTQVAAISVTALVVLLLWRREWRNQFIEWIKSNL